MHTATSIPQPASFESEGWAVRQNQTANIYGHICLRMKLLEAIPDRSEQTIIFTVSEGRVPQTERPIIESTVRLWCAEFTKSIRNWRIEFEVFDGSSQKG